MQKMTSRVDACHQAANKSWPLEQGFSNLSVGIACRTSYDDTFRVSIQEVWGDTQKVTVLTSSQVVLILLLVQEPHFGNHYSNVLLLTPPSLPIRKGLTPTPKPCDARWNPRSAAHKLSDSRQVLEVFGP